MLNAVTTGAVVSPAGGGVQACVSTGCVVGVPVQFAGVLPVTVLVCWPFAPQPDHAEYVYPVHATGGGVQACVSTGCVVGVPVQFAGVLPVTVLVCWPFAPQPDHAEYVYPVHAAAPGVLVALPGKVPELISARFEKPSLSESRFCIAEKLRPFDE
jgi:hypothetical protein